LCAETLGRLRVRTTSDLADSFAPRRGQVSLPLLPEPGMWGRFTRETAAVCEGRLTRNCARRGGPTADNASKADQLWGSVSRVKPVVGGVRRALGFSGCAASDPADLRDHVSLAGAGSRFTRETRPHFERELDGRARESWPLNTSGREERVSNPDAFGDGPIQGSSPCSSGRVLERGERPGCCGPTKWLARFARSALGSQLLAPAVAGPRLVGAAPAFQWPGPRYPFAAPT